LELVGTFVKWRTPFLSVYEKISASTRAVLAVEIRKIRKIILLQRIPMLTPIMLPLLAHAGQSLFAINNVAYHD
jgi:hypothetical protein